jgi:hypothetical protein
LWAFGGIGDSDRLAMGEAAQPLEDHAAHVPGRSCARCGRPIQPGEAARLRGKADWVHDVCP